MTEAKFFEIFKKQLDERTPLTEEDKSATRGCTFFNEEHEVGQKILFWMVQLEHDEFDIEIKITSLDYPKDKEKILNGYQFQRMEQGYPILKRI